MGRTLSIGELARATGTKVKTVRHYERIRLLPKPDRTSGNYRAYSVGELSHLIRDCRQALVAECLIIETLAPDELTQ